MRRNRGGREFLLKWGISQHEFTHGYVRATARAGAQALATVPHPGLVGRLKRLLYALRQYPTGDLRGWEPNLPAQLVVQPSDEAAGR